MSKLLIKCIHFYQKSISPSLGANKCGFSPTCSQYEIESLEEHGALKGTMFALWRILRCNPFNKNTGYDPVISGKKKES